jgi:hypothetical protein
MPAGWPVCPLVPGHAALEEKKGDIPDISAKMEPAKLGVSPLLCPRPIETSADSIPNAENRARFLQLRYGIEKLGRVV